MIIKILTFSFAAYLTVIFFLSRLFVPLLRKSNCKIHDKLPKDMQKTIYKIKKKSKGKYEFLKNSYDYLIRKYHGGRLITLVRVDLLFLTDIETIWKRKGYIPCTQHNYLLRIFLINSGFFDEKDIMRKHTFVNFNIHQYLKVNINGKWINVDPAGDHFGIKFGGYTKGFA